MLLSIAMKAFKIQITEKEIVMCESRKFLLSILVSLMVSLTFFGWIKQTQSQEKYPTRSIEIIVPFVPGGTNDLSCRIIATHLNKRWGVPVTVVNKPGGNTVPACLEVHTSKPDGHTLLSDGLSSSSSLGLAVKNLPFKIMDRTFLPMICSCPLVIIVPSASSFKTMKDIESEVKRDPENFTYASLGGSSSPDYVIRQFFKAIGVDVQKMKPVMVQGASAAVTLVAGGHVKVSCSTTASANVAISGGLVRPLAITSKERSPRLPDVPTTAELGYPTVNFINWVSISGPPKLPSHIVEKWERTMEEVLKDADVISKLNSMWAEPFYLNSRETREYIIKETEEMNRVFTGK
jgi:tripartite-type tricarboxylate transporter receptor subunit TctC